MGRRRRLGFWGWVVGVGLVLVGVVGVPLGVSAVQNIFAGFGQITDIQYGGDSIDQVVYQGTTIWERVPDSTPIQTITTANCPNVRTRVGDARDNATYWVQKLADGRCWMLTNLAYAGGGANIYGDAKTIYLNSTNVGATYTVPQYYVPAGANRTMGITDPSISTTGIGQYGYLYNWCAAMGGQSGTAACMATTTPVPDQGISICPAGWRLPTGGTGGEFQQMTDAIGATTNGASEGTAGSAVIRSVWLGAYGGLWNDGFTHQGGGGAYWSSSQYPSSLYNTYRLDFNWTLVVPSNNYARISGHAVRCVAD